jgi:hypothetical protein
MHFIKKMKYLKDYKLILTFNDKKTKIVNLEKYLDKGVFLPLRNLDYFKKARLNKEAGTIVWPNDADFCPDVLYRIGKDTRTQP